MDRNEPTAASSAAQPGGRSLHPPRRSMAASSGRWSEPCSSASQEVQVEHARHAVEKADIVPALAGGSGARDPVCGNVGRSRKPQGRAASSGKTSARQCSPQRGAVVASRLGPRRRGLLQIGLWRGDELLAAPRAAEAVVQTKRSKAQICALAGRGSSGGTKRITSTPHETRQRRHALWPEVSGPRRRLRARRRTMPGTDGANHVGSRRGPRSTP